MNVSDVSDDVTARSLLVGGSVGKKRLPPRETLIFKLNTVFMRGNLSGKVDRKSSSTPNADFSAIYNDHADWMRKEAESYNVNDAQDLVQDTFMKLLRIGSLEKLKAIGVKDQRNYLRCCLHNQISRSWRMTALGHRSGGYQHVPLWDDLGYPLEILDCQACVPGEPTLGTFLQDVDDALKILQSKLNPDTWTRVYPYLWKSDSEPLPRMNGALRVALFRARAQLKEILGKKHA